MSDKNLTVFVDQIGRTIIAEEVKPSLGYTKVYYFQELNCEKTEVEFTYERLIENVQAISVVVYQELTTDIKGDPN